MQKKSSESGKKIAIVLGPHRSGTSLLAAGLESLGAYLSIKQPKSSDENPKGFFENEEIVDFNERLLKFLGGSWENPLFDGRRAIGIQPDADLTFWLDEAAEIIHSNFDGQAFVAVKDPRICQLLPFWKKVLDSCGFDEANTYYIHTNRHPIEVAKSQYKRRQNNPGFYCLGDNLLETVSLWFSQSYQALRDVRSGNNIFLLYTDLLDEPRDRLIRLAKCLRVDYSENRINDFCTHFVDKKLRRNSVSAEENSLLRRKFPEALQFFDELKSLALKKTFSRKDARKALGLWRRPEARIHHLDPVIHMLSRLTTERRVLNFRLTHLQDETERRQGEFDSAWAELEERLNTLRIDRDRIRTNLETERDRQREAYERELSSTREQLAGIHRESSELGVAYRRQLDELREAKDTQIDALRTETDRQREAYERELSSTREQLAGVLRESSELRIEFGRQLDSLSAEKDKLSAENNRLQADLSGYIDELSTRADAQAEIALIKNSLSWRITGPLRSVRTVQRNAAGALGAKWIKLRGRARNTNQNLKSRAPGLSRIAHALLSPFFRLADKTLAGPGYRQIEQETLDTTSTSSGYQSEYQLGVASHPENPLVTIIVPNYNHAAYLEKRLDTVYSQTYENYEVILLDDGSADDSRRIIEEYCSRYPDKTQAIFNETNSGGVFYQWKKGLAAASGNLIWIAESDDWCSSNFLQELVGYFADEAVMLAYCRTVFMDAGGKNQIWTIEQYLSDIDPELWQAPFVRTAHQIVNSAWAIKNIVPNVSSALFRNPTGMDLLDEEAWKRMRICGDWVFYLHMIRGGLVAYSPAATNYYRIHGSNTSVATYSNDSYYVEYGIVAGYINRFYSVPERVFDLQRAIIKQHWVDNRPDFSEEELGRCYNIEQIKALAKERKPNLLMASYAFAAGGGETFPIQLANLFKRFGYGVTFLSCEQEEREINVRSMLRADIPVVCNFSQVEKIVDDFGIEIIHSHHAWVDNTIIDLLPEDSSCQTVISTHGMYEAIGVKDLKRILPRLASRTGKLVYTADKNLKPFVDHGLFEDEKFVKIGNALDLYPVSPVDLSELGIAENAFVLCLVSRAMPEKGWREAVKTVRLARKISARDIQLILIGEGVEYDYLQRRGYPDYVHLLGFRRNIRDYYAASDLGYLPSRFRSESFPLTVIDCLHSGKPVLASAIAEIPKMLQAGDKIAGCLFPLENWKIPVRQVAEIIARCATDPEYYRELERLVPEAAAKFSPVVMRDKYHDVYTALVDAGKEAQQTNVKYNRDAQSA